MVRLRVERKIKGHDRRCFEAFQNDFTEIQDQEGTQN